MVAVLVGIRATTINAPALMSAPILMAIGGLSWATIRPATRRQTSGPAAKALATQPMLAEVRSPASLMAGNRDRDAARMKPEAANAALRPGSCRPAESGP